MTTETTETTRGGPEGLAVERRVPLSFNLDFLRAFDQGDDAGPFGPRYHVVHGWWARGPLDLDRLQAALDDVVARHEALRTRLVRGDDPHQRVHAPCPVPLTVRELTGDRAAAAEQLLVDVEAGIVDATAVPQLRAVVGRFDADEHVVVLMAHHTSTDGYAMRIIARDLVERYAARGGYDRPPLPAPGQLGDHAVAERAAVEAGEHDAARAFWSRQLEGADIHTHPTDHARSAGRTPTTTGMHRFLVPAEVARPVLRTAREGRGSPFMALLAAYAVFVHRSQGATDLTVPTFSPGRGEGHDDTVGSFFNFLPVRTDLEGAGGFREVFARIRRSCLVSYSHDTPMIIGTQPSVMARGVDDRHATCVFQVFPYPHLLDDTAVGDITWTEIRLRLRDQELCTDIPDGVLWSLNLDTDGSVIGHIAFKRHLYESATIRRWAAEFCSVLAEVAADPDAPLSGDAPAADVA